MVLVIVCTVWLSSWEWQCCGDEFAIGDEVTWGLLPASPSFLDRLAVPLGRETVSAITHDETHHGGAEFGPTQMLTVGRVQEIKAAFWDSGPRSALEPGRYPIEGSGRMESRNAFRRFDDVDLEGLVVRLAV